MENLRQRKGNMWYINWLRIKNVLIPETKYKNGNENASYEIHWNNKIKYIDIYNIYNIYSLLNFNDKYKKIDTD